MIDRPTGERKLTLTIDGQLYNILVGLAAENNRSLSNYVETVLWDHVEETDEQKIPA